MKTYYIIRFYENGDKEQIDGNLSLDEVKKHCNNKETSGINEQGIRFFDGYSQE